jgi:hypothetical protein
MQKVAKEKIHLRKGLHSIFLKIGEGEINLRHQ